MNQSRIAHESTFGATSLRPPKRRHAAAVAMADEAMKAHASGFRERTARRVRACPKKPQIRFPSEIGFDLRKGSLKATELEHPRFGRIRGFWTDFELVENMKRKLDRNNR